jgi:hypothetical protein
LLVDSKINFWVKNVFNRPSHKLNEMILLHLERILISSDCVSQHFINMKSSSWRLSRKMTKTILYSLLCTWLASWSLAGDIEIFVHWINKIYSRAGRVRVMTRTRLGLEKLLDSPSPEYTLKITNTKHISTREKPNMKDLDLLFHRGKTILIVSNSICFCYATFVSVMTKHNFH